MVRSIRLLSLFFGLLLVSSGCRLWIDPTRLPNIAPPRTHFGAQEEKAMLRCNRMVTILLLVALLLSACQPLRLPSPCWPQAAAAPKLTRLGHIGGPALTVAVQDNYAFLGFSYELTVLDVTDHSRPQWVADLPLPTNDIVLVGDYTYIVGRGGLTILDITDPAQPQTVGRLTTAQTPTSVAATQGQLYVAEERRLHVVDVTRPTQPRRLATLTLPAHLEDIYLGDNIGDVWIVDRTAPPQPITAPRYTALGQVEAMAVAAGYAYLPDQGVGVRILAIAPNGELTQVALYAMTAQVRKIVVADGYAYLAADQQGLFMLDVHEPRAPTLVRHVVPPGTAYDLALIDHYALIAAGDAGLQVLDIADPAQAGVVAAFATPACARQVVSANGLIYVMDALGGLYILQLSG